MQYQLLFDSPDKFTITGTKLSFSSSKLHLLPNESIDTNASYCEDGITPPAENGYATGYEYSTANPITSLPYTLGTNNALVIDLGAKYVLQQLTITTDGGMLTISSSQDNSTWTGIRPYTSVAAGTQTINLNNTVGRYVGIYAPGVTIEGLRVSTGITFPTSWQYVVPTAANRIVETRGIRIDSMSATLFEPTNTELRFLVSFNNGQTWNYYNSTNSTWVETDLSNIGTHGMTWFNVVTYLSGRAVESGKLAIATGLRSSNGSTTPYIVSQTIDYSYLNTPPVPPANLPDRIGYTKTFFGVQLDPFTDADNDPVSHSMENLPPGLSFDPNTRILKGYPTTTGEYTVAYKGNDGSVEVTAYFKITINESPYVSHLVSQLFNPE